jgi:hypothetical protein
MADQSINITFVTAEVAAGESLVVDLDADMNDDKSQFEYGEKAYFRIFAYPDSMIITVEKSDGTITSEGSGEAEVEEDIVFANTNTATSSKPVKSIVSQEWLGTSLGSVSATGTKITASQEGVAVLKLTYKADFERRALSLPTQDEDEYTVVIFIQGTV